MRVCASACVQARVCTRMCVHCMYPSRANPSSRSYEHRTTDPTTTRSNHPTHYSGPPTRIFVFEALLGSVPTKINYHLPSLAVPCFIRGVDPPTRSVRTGVPSTAGLHPSHAVLHGATHGIFGQADRGRLPSAYYQTRHGGSWYAMPAFLPACLLPVCLSACLPACLPARLPARLSVCLSACLLACLPSASLPACLPARLLARPITCCLQACLIDRLPPHFFLAAC